MHVLKTINDVKNIIDGDPIIHHCLIIININVFNLTKGLLFIPCEIFLHFAVFRRRIKHIGKYLK